jgi:hypothetical protein
MMPDNLPVKKSGKVLIPAVRPKDEAALISAVRFFTGQRF